MAKSMALSQRIQDWVLYYAVTDTSFLQLIRDSVKSEYFNPITSEYIEMCYQHFDKTRRAPRIYFSELTDQFAAELPRPDRKPHAAYLDRVFSSEVPETEILISQLADFVQAKSIENGILSAASMLDSGDIGNARFLLSSALESSFNTVDDVSRVITDDFNFEFDESQIVCKTGFPTFDQYIRGWMRKQFVFVLAGTKVGKTWCLIHLARTAMKSGSNVLYITHEITRKQVEERMFMMAGALVNESHPSGMYVQLESGKVWRPSVCDNSRILKAQQVMRRKQYGEMYIKEYPYASATKNDINACIDRIESKYNTKIDVVVNDYADIMQLPKSQEHRHALADIYRWHRTLAGERDILTMTVSQTTRAAQDSENIGIKDVQEDFQKAQIADAVIALCANQKRPNDEMFAKLLLNRGDVQGMRCGILKNYQIGQFMLKSWELRDDEGTEDEDNEDLVDADAEVLYKDKIKK